jgi:hypothetical protein
VDDAPFATPPAPKGLFMASTTRKWVIGCGLGCAGAIVLAIVVPLLFGLAMMGPMNRAVDAQKALTAEMGDRDSYMPPAGVPGPDRLEAFLAVRRAVMPLCPRFTEIAADFERMDDLGSQSDRPGKGEMFRAITQVSGSVLGIIGDIGELNQARNEALLAERMGLGEYTWLYTLVYHSWLGHPVPDGGHGTGDGDSESDSRHVEKQRISLIGMMRRHAGALDEAGQAESATVWREEADRLERSADEAPFPGGGLPPGWAAAFAARGDELRAAWCEPMAEFELGQVRKSGMSVHTE